MYHHTYLKTDSQYSSHCSQDSLVTNFSLRMHCTILRNWLCQQSCRPFHQSSSLSSFQWSLLFHDGFTFHHHNTCRCSCSHTFCPRLTYTLLCFCHFYLCLLLLLFYLIMQSPFFSLRGRCYVRQAGCLFTNLLSHVAQWSTSRSRIF
jgi:hypothetical protein